jgi:hypothetical protein
MISGIPKVNECYDNELKEYMTYLILKYVNKIENLDKGVTKDKIYNDIYSKIEVSVVYDLKKFNKEYKKRKMDLEKLKALKKSSFSVGVV